MKSRSEHLSVALSEVESPGVTTIGENWPIFWESAQGSTVTDVDGKHYIDMTAAFGVMSVGHSNPNVTRAITAQAERLIHGMGDVHPPAIKVDFLRALSGICPAGLNRAILGLNGADAVEAALKCAQLVTGHANVIAFDGAYHGLSYGALTVTSRHDFKEPFAGRLGGHTQFLPFPGDDSAADNALGMLRNLMDDNPYAAVIIEPIQGRGGVRIPVPGFMKALRTLCDSNHCLLIADEIFTGLGRTGSWFAMEHEGVTPDLLCLGKALGGGMPLSACVGGKTSIDQWPKATGEALHTSTFLGHPISCAAGLAALDEIQTQNLPERSRQMGLFALDRLKDAPIVALRGRGLMIGLEVESGDRAFTIVKRALDKGLILLPSGINGQVISLTPPLIITEDELNRALDIILSCLHQTPA